MCFQSVFLEVDSKPLAPAKDTLRLFYSSRVGTVNRLKLQPIKSLYLFTSSHLVLSPPYVVLTCTAWFITLFVFLQKGKLRGVSSSQHLRPTGFTFQRSFETLIKGNDLWHSWISGRRLAVIFSTLPHLCIQPFEKNHQGLASSCIGADPCWIM